ncbi:MAG TPA: ATP-binding cassette domain-containing protein, partial [Patescibacteria group bacterium]|nr:ATP-binding cassette domain-containing protein [Patescibacteria group bacterium]
RKLENKLFLPEDWKILEIKDLFFTYKGEYDGEKEERQTINGVSLKIERGKRIAFIGVSGSGKSTILSLLRGLHEADKVSAYCDGKKLKNGLKHIYESSTLIPQEPEIFNNTIEYNITLGVNVDRRKIKKVMRLANLEALIARLKKGLRTNVMEKGVSLSGGEKQRLALARGLLAAEDSEFLFLDEPTSSVDIGNERQIYQNIFEAFKGKAIISSVHSLHLLRNFDYIYMFRGSQIISEGDFSAMLEDPNFKELWENYNMELKEKEGWTKITQQ